MKNNEEVISLCIDEILKLKNETNCSTSELMALEGKFSKLWPHRNRRTTHFIRSLKSRLFKNPDFILLYDDVWNEGRT